MIDMNVVKNVVIEIVSDEDGEVSVNVVNLGEWKWLSFVWCDNESNRMGSVKEVVFDIEDRSYEKFGEELWKLYEKKFVELFDEYKKEEDEREWYNEDVDWVKIKEEFLSECKKYLGDGYNLSMVKVGGYSVECDNELVVIIGRS